MKKVASHVDERPAQQVATDLRDAILIYIQRHFYAEFPAERFWADRRLLLRYVVLWPAKWLADRGVTLTADRYEQILVGTASPRGVLVDASTLGQPPHNPVKYLATVVQKHFEVQGERYYEEGKALRSKLDPIMKVLSGIQTAPKQDPVAAMASAADLLAAPKRRKTKKPAVQAVQMDFLS